MPDFEYRQTVGHDERASTERGQQPQPSFALSAASRWCRVGRQRSARPTEPGSGRRRRLRAEQTLPQLVDGQQATLTQPRVQAKQTQPPPRYNEGTLVDAMQNAWRFVKDEALRERLKEAKGIGTPATRAEIIKGLKRQNLLAADGKLVVPTPAGLQLFELLRGRRARAGRSRHHRGLGDAARRCRGRQRGFPRRHRRDRRRGGSVDRMLRRHTGQTVDLNQPPPSSARKGRRSKADASGGGEAKTRRSRAGTKSAARGEPRPHNVGGGGGHGPSGTAKPPTEKMVAFAQRLAKDKSAKLPRGYDKDFEICRRFLDQHSGR